MEENKTVATEVTETQTETQGVDYASENETLKAQLAEANARADKNKIELDKALKEVGALKKDKRASMTEAERILAEKEEAEKIREEEFKAMQERVNRSEAMQAYRDVSDEKIIESLIEAAGLEADHKEIYNAMRKFADAEVKKAQTEFLKNRPRVNIGGDGALTKEQFNNMSMVEKSKLYRENKAEYDRLSN